MSPSFRLLGDVDAPRPVRAVAGNLALSGWCIVENSPVPPNVRLTVGEVHLPMTTRHARDDVARLLPDQPAAAQSGFTIAGRLPAGVHWARLEALRPDGEWGNFHALCIAAEARPFAVGIDAPADDQPVTQRVFIAGWALHPAQPIRTLSVRYGHQEIDCTLGGKRTDVPELYPTSPEAAQSGFRSNYILHAGRGPMRVRARLADGSIALARSNLTINVATDENHGPEIDFSATPIALPRSAPQYITAPSARAVHPFNLLFILPGSFASNSALHVAALANELSRAGHTCLVAVPHDVGTLAQHLAPAFRGLTYADTEHDLGFPDGRGPDLIHAWTTRENVRQLTATLRARHPARVVVHLEDNEQQILALSLQRTVAALEALSTEELDRLVPPDLSHPHRSRDFLREADGVTMITEPLREFIPDGLPAHLITPAADARYFYPHPRPLPFRAALGYAAETTFLFYHGNIHAANAAEMRELYLALLLLNRKKRPTVLIRTGRDQVDFLSDLAGELAPFVLHLGEIPHHHHLPPLMALADIFVQPGRADAFNTYRFPSKLPEFFNLGRPVILPRTNLGTNLHHGIDAYVLDVADAASIATAVGELRDDRPFYDRLAQGAVDFAAQHFSWRRSAEALAKFYASLPS